LKPRLHFSWGWIAVFVLGLFKLALKIFEHPERTTAYIVIFTLVGLIFLGYLIIVFWPGQGKLTLTPSGFRVDTLWWLYRIDYRWSEVQGFYVWAINHSEQGEKQVFIQLANNTPGKRRQHLHYFYDIDVYDLSDLLNEWKLRYAAPVTVTAPSDEEIDAEIKTAWKRNLLIILGIIAIVVAGGFLAASLLHF